MALTNQEVLKLMRPYFSSQFTERIPDIEKANMSLVGETMTAYPTIANEFVQVLTNQVIRTMFFTRALDNPLAMFEKGDLSKFGKSLELIYVDIIKGKDFTDRFGDTYEGEVLRPEAVTNVKVQYLTENSRLKYKVTISTDMLASAFKNQNGLSSLANQLVSKMVESYNIDKFLMTWKLIDTMKTTQILSTRPCLGDKASTQKFARDVKKLIKDMRFPSNKFNASGVTTKSLPSDLFIIVDTDTSAVLDVTLLAEVFNMSKVEFQSRIVEVPAFGSNKTVAYIVDRDKLQIYSTKYASDTVKNGAGLFTNVFLHRWDLFGACDFANCVELVTEKYTRPILLDGSSHNTADPSYTSDTICGGSRPLPYEEVKQEMPYDTIEYGTRNEDGTVKADLSHTEIEIDSNGEIKSKKERKIKK